MKNPKPIKTETVTLKKLQIVFGVAYHPGEREVPENVAFILRKRGMLEEPAAEPVEPAQTDTEPKTPPAKAGKKAAPADG